MTKEEAYSVLIKAGNLYQPIVGFPDASKKECPSFFNRIRSIADYCGHKDSYFIGGFAMGYDCFQLVDLGAKVKGVDDCSGRHCENSMEIAQATAIYHDYHPDNPEFIFGKFPEYFYSTEDKCDWVVMMMVLHNMLKFMDMSEIFKMLNNIADHHARKGFIMTTRGKISPKQIVDNTVYTKFEEVPCPRRPDGKRDIAFGFPIWSFYE